MWKKVLSVIGVILATWLIIAPTLLFWLIFVAILGTAAAGLIEFAIWNSTERQKLLDDLKKYWWIWTPAILASFVTTVVLSVLGWMWNLPRGFLYLWILISWLLVIIVMACYFNHQVAIWVRNWWRAGGFWLFWSEENSPANSLLVVWLVVVLAVFLYGPPTPKLSAEKVVRYTHSISENPVIQEAREIGNFGLQLAFGSEGFQTSESTKRNEQSPYQKGWFWIKFAFFLFPFTVMGMILSRRDWVTDNITALIEILKKRKEILSAEASTAPTAEAGEGVAAPAPAIPRVLHAPFSRLFASDMLAEFSIRLLQGLVGVLK